MRDIRTLELSKGSPEKCLLASEEACRRKLGKTAVAARTITKGKTLAKEDVVIKVNIYMYVVLNETKRTVA